jgi:hypothetical protein
MPRLLGAEYWAAHQDALGIEAWWAFACTDLEEIALTSLPTHAAHLTAVTATTATYPVTPKYHLLPEQWQALTCLGWTNRIARLARRWNLETPPTHSALENITRQALAYGLSDETDLLRYAHCALTLHPRFDAHPQVQQALQPKGLGFAKAVQTWSEVFIEELRSGAWLQTANAQQPTLIYSQN